MTEAAAVRVVDGQVAARYESLANAGVSLAHPSGDIDGITQQMVDAAPPTSVVMHELLEFIGHDPVIAHDAAFVRQVFDGECTRAGLSAPTREFICSRQLARRVYPHFGNHSLETLARALGLYCPSPALCAATAVDVAASVVVQLCEQLRTSLDGATADESLLRQVMEMPPKHAVFMFANARVASFVARSN